MIPLGILATAGAGGGGASSYELISTAYGTGSSDTIEFSSIPSTYKHLQVRGTLRSLKSASVDDVFMRFNGLSGTNYAWHQLIGDGSSVYSSNDFNVGGMDMYQAPAASAASNITYSFIADIADYASTSKNKTVKAITGLALTSFNNVGVRSGLLKSTSAISSIRIQTSSAESWSTISRVSLYGIKG